MMKLSFWRVRTIGVFLVGMVFYGLIAMAQEATRGGPTDPLITYRAIGLGFASSLAIAATVIGAAYAVGRIGSAALGAAAEKPELLTRSILFVALAEGLAVLGFAIAMMLIQKI